MPLLRATGRALWYILKDLQEAGHLKSFAIFATGEHKQKVSTFTTTEDSKVFLGDVENMYTNLSHTSLHQAVDWIMNLAEEHLPMKHGMLVSMARKPAFRPIYAKQNRTIRTKHFNHTALLSVESIKEILKWDVNNVFFTLGNQILKQCQGIPMGSPCSPALAILVCSKAEHTFVIEKGEEWVQQHFYASRYIDDLYVICNDPHFDMEDIKHIYPDPLTLKPENPGKEKTVVFLDASTTVPDIGGKVQITHHHKRAAAILAGKRIPKSITPFNSHVPQHIKFGTVVGGLHRALAASNTSRNISQSISTTMAQFTQHGMSNTFCTTRASAVLPYYTKHFV